ncbi:MAG: hypothetical protein H0Z33_11100 [Bacillaceae bacterium]|nr:hypothetical protein [Bacillaceae bacterium]
MTKPVHKNGVRLHYVEGLKKAIEECPEKVNDMLKAVCESPFQSEAGDLWVSKSLASDILLDLLLMAMTDRDEPSGDYSYERLQKEIKSAETNGYDDLLHILF